MWKWLSLFLIAPLLALTQVAGVLAHARYDHSTPSPGQVMATAPSKIDIYTAQDMRKVTGQNEITVTGPDGSQADTGNTVVDDANRRHLSVDLKPNLAPGRYLVDFKTWSDEDGERDHGAFAFYIGAGPTAAQKAEDAKLQLTTDTATADVAPTSSSHTGEIIAIAVGVAVFLVVVGGGVGIVATRRRKI